MLFFSMAQQTSDAKRPTLPKSPDASQAPSSECSDWHRFWHLLSAGEAPCADRRRWTPSARLAPANPLESPAR